MLCPSTVYCTHLYCDFTRYTVTLHNLLWLYPLYGDLTRYTVTIPGVLNIVYRACGLTARALFGRGTIMPTSIFRWHDHPTHLPIYFFTRSTHSFLHFCLNYFFFFVLSTLFSQYFPSNFSALFSSPPFPSPPLPLPPSTCTPCHHTHTHTTHTTHAHHFPPFLRLT